MSLLPLGLFLFGLTFALASTVEAESRPHACRDRSCSVPVTKLNVGKFSFSADLYYQRNQGEAQKECMDSNLSCQFELKFGVPGKIISYSSGGSESYRIINGPLPLGLNCIDGSPRGFADLSVKEAGWELARIGHRAYYKNPPHQTFPFFSKQPHSIGVLIGSWGASGRGSSLIYVFDSQTGRMSRIKADECGYGIDFVKTPEGVVSGYVRWKSRYYFGPPNFAAIYIDFPYYKNLDGQDLSLTSYIISNPFSVIPDFYRRIQINIF